MGHTDSAPLEYVEFVLSREMKWGDIDAIPTYQVDRAISFLGLESRYRKAREGVKH